MLINPAPHKLCLRACGGDVPSYPVIPLINYMLPSSLLFILVTVGIVSVGAIIAPS
jgi:hypothetical protein